MTDLDRLWITVALAHGDHISKGDREEIDLTRPPALGRKKEGWVRYVTALLMLVQKATRGQGGLKLEYNRFLSRRSK